ncbi:MAG: cobalamin-binding protein [Candidatus Rokuibacteriota bacterium]|nr:MAG: cobalamin-binding protein [Candidatus Rokubacteria bacterium]
MIRALAAVALLALASPAHALVLRDMLGREVTLAGPPTRIVSLVPSVTESAFALGGEARIVGVSDFCDWPPAARAKPRVGGMVNPSLETLVALKPDLVVGTDEGNREETFVQLQRLGIPVYIVHAHRISEMYDLIARVGALTGRRDAVGPLVAGIQRRIDAVRAAVKARPAPRVLYVLWPDPLLVPGRDSHLTEMIELAGGRSITAGEPVSYVRFSIEAAVARAPEVIVLADHSTGASTAGRAAPEKWQALTSVPAIRAGRLYSVDLSVLHRYGPRVPEGLELLARMIHPEAFK